MSHVNLLIIHGKDGIACSIGKSSTLPHAAIDHVYQNSHGIWYILAWTFGGLWGGVRLFGTFGTKETNSFLKTKHHD